MKKFKVKIKIKESSLFGFEKDFLSPVTHSEEAAKSKVKERFTRALVVALQSGHLDYLFDFTVSKSRKGKVISNQMNEPYLR